MIGFLIGFIGWYAIIAVLILFELQEFLLGNDRPAPKGKPWWK